MQRFQIETVPCNIILKKRLDNFRILAVDGQGYNKCNCKQNIKQINTNVGLWQNYVYLNTMIA